PHIENARCPYGTPYEDRHRRPNGRGQPAHCGKRYPRPSGREEVAAEKGRGEPITEVGECLVPSGAAAGIAQPEVHHPGRPSPARTRRGHRRDRRNDARTTVSQAWPSTIPSSAPYS